MTAVGRGQEIIETRKMPMRMAPLTRYNIRNTVNILPNQIINFLISVKIGRYTPANEYTQPHRRILQNMASAITRQVGANIVCNDLLFSITDSTRAVEGVLHCGKQPPSPTRLVVSPPTTPRPPLAERVMSILLISPMVDFTYSDL